VEPLAFSGDLDLFNVSGNMTSIYSSNFSIGQETELI